MMAGGDLNSVGVDPTSMPVPFVFASDKIYSWFHEGQGAGPTTDTSTDTWQSIATGHSQVSDSINKALSDSNATWEGQAADQMRSSTSPLATWADVTGSSATQAGGQTAQLGDAFRTAQNSVQQPVSVPSKPWYDDYVPWNTDYDNKVKQSQQVDQANMQVLNTYASSANSVSSGMPTFQSPDQVNGGVQPPVNPPSPPPVNPPPVGPPPSYPPNPPGGGGYNPPGGGNNPPGGGNNPPGGPPGGYQPPPGDKRTTPVRSDPPTPIGPIMPPPGRPPGGGPYPPGGPGGPGDPPFGGFPGLPGGPGGPGDPNGPGGGRYGGGRGGGPGGPGLGGGRGGLGGGGLGGPGKGLGGPGSNAFGPRGGPGSGSLGGGASAGALAAEEAAAGGGRGGAGGLAGARGAAGQPGAGGMGAGGHGGKGEEDKEHKSASYLQETEDIFGDGQLVAPPVIGDIG